MRYVLTNAVATINTVISLSSLHVFTFLPEGLYLEFRIFCMQTYQLY